MSDATEPVPSLSDDEPEKPAAPVLSKSEQKRRNVMRGRPMMENIDRVKQVTDEHFPPGPAPRIYARWRVVEETEVPSGASTFLLRREQVLSEQQYDVQKLLALGVRLEKLPD